MSSPSPPPPSSGNPLKDALPPATDYLTYLALVEYNLTVDNLSVLHEVLQDVQLTTNIGWDLVHILLPLLPASQQCLLDIARLGNPREVILKVTECLRLLDFAGLEPDDADDDSVVAPRVTAPVSGEGSSTQAVELTPTPLPVDQFICLLSMLSTLHPRIKTQYPSRFLSTSLQAVLSAFSSSVSHKEDLISAVVRFVKDISGRRRPHIPTRSSSSSLLLSRLKDHAPDPESDAASAAPDAVETQIQGRLLQSLITHVAEEYLLSLSSSEDVPGLCWSSRLQEKLHPERSVAGRPSFAEKFEHDPALKARLSAVGDLLALTRDLGLSQDDLLSAASIPADQSDKADAGEADPPKSASEVPLSMAGSFLLYTARLVSTVLYSTPDPSKILPLFPDHAALLRNLISDSISSTGLIGSEPEPILDSLLATALLSLEHDQIGQPADADAFNHYLQQTSLVSANCPSPSLRYTAYYLTTTVLRSNPSDVERLAFIRDTLEHCPYDNLKAAAVSWVKGETIEAYSSSSSSKAPPSIFATPLALSTLAPHLFPPPPPAHDHPLLAALHPFHVAALNLLLLLLTADHGRLASLLAVPELLPSLRDRFLGPLGDAVAGQKAAAAEGGELVARWADEGVDAGAERGRVAVLEAVLERVNVAAAGLEGQSAAGRA